MTLPSPEELGVAPQSNPISNVRIDWNVMHDRLQRLGGMGWQTGELPDGRFRAAFVLRTNQPDHVHHVEATAQTEAEAVGAALASAEQWATSSRP